MKARKTKIIKDKKERGEWAESVFVARASEQGLPVSKPWGDSRSFDCVVGRPGKFVAVQVKCTITKLESGKGYICSTCSSHKAYRAGAFDFLAACVIPEDAWYIIPAREIRGLKSISVHGGERGSEVREISGGVGVVAGGDGFPRNEDRASTSLRAGSGWGSPQHSAHVILGAAFFAGRRTYGLLGSASATGNLQGSFVAREGSSG